MSDTLEPERVGPLLRGQFGTPFLYERSCDSTQSLLGPGLPEGAVAVAEHQTAGRGRRGRRWDAPAGSAILCSVLLRPPSSRPLPELALVGGIALALAIEHSVGCRCGVRWPNDVLVSGQKVAGVLAEGRGDHAVLGLGVNVNQAPGELPTDTRTPAASLRMISGVQQERAPLLAAVLEALEASYRAWSAEGLAAVLPALRERDVLGGRRIMLDGKLAKAIGITDGGRLEVDLDGTRLLVTSGEVTVVD